MPVAPIASSETNSVDDQFLSCPLCNWAQRVPPPPAGHIAACVRCKTPLAGKKPHSIQRTLALSLAALILYIPANLFPIMSFEYYGAAEHSTIWSGVRNLAESGMWFIAAVVFLASIVVPFLKLAALFFLALSAGTGRGAFWKTKLYRSIKAIGPWAMLDVFLLAVLVAAVKLGQLANVRPGPAALPFTLVVVFTILAAESFEPALLWQHDRRIHR